MPPDTATEAKSKQGSSTKAPLPVKQQVQPSAQIQGIIQQPLLEEHTSLQPVRTSQLVRDQYLARYGLVINKALKGIICEEHHQALTGVPRHLRDFHNEKIDLDKLDSICQHHHIVDLPVIAPTVEGIEPFDALPIMDGFCCLRCGYVGKTEATVGTHSSKEHPAKKKKVEPCKYQVLSRKETHKANFRVHNRVVSTSTEPLYALMQDLRRQVDTATKIRESDLNRRMVSPWLLASEWHIHVEGHNKEDLIALVEGRREEDKDLRDWVRRYFDAASDLIPQTDRLVKQKLNSPKPGEITNEPLKQMQQKETLKTYVASAISLLTLLFRNKKNYKLPLPNSIATAVQDLKHALLQKQSNNFNELLHQLLISLWSHPWRQTQDNLMPDPTVRCLALRSIKPDGGFQHPKNVTPDIARFEYLMRLAGVQEVHRLANTLYQGDQHRALNDVIPWLQEKNVCTFDSIRSLMHIASSIVFNSPSLPKVMWVDRKNYTHLVFQGHDVRLDDLRKACMVLQQNTQKHWCNEVLMGLDLRVVYGNSIAEDLTNSKVGYNFLSDQRNTAFRDRDRLIRAVMGSHKHRNEFFRQDSDGTYVPLVSTWRKWLLKYCQFNMDMNVMVEVTAGAPTRMTELTSMLCRNTEYRVRNWSHMSHHSTVNLTYSKTGSITGQDKLIPHALDAFSADLMIQDHAIARPFAELACQIVYPGNATKMDLYRNRLFVGNGVELTTQDISLHMHKIYNPIVKFDLGVQAFRQIHASFSRHHCGQMEALLEASEVNTAQILQYGHNRSIHDQIYGVSADSTAGPSEEILPLFLDASTDWQKKLTLVQGGIMLPYDQVTAEHFELFQKDSSQQKTSISNALDEDVIANKVAESLKPFMRALFAEGFAQLTAAAQPPSSLSKLNPNSSMDSSFTQVEAPALHRDTYSEEPPLQQNANAKILSSQLSSSSEAPLSDHNTITKVSTLKHNMHTEDMWDSFESHDEDDPTLHMDDNPLLPQASTRLNTEPAPILDRMPQTGPHVSSHHTPMPPIVPKMDQAMAIMRILLKDPNATWKSDGQKMALTHILERQEDVIFISPTGGGKSIAYELPARLEVDSGYTVALFPLNSLLDDVQRRLNLSDTRYERVLPGATRISGEHPLIISSYDTAKSKKWQGMLRQLNDQDPTRPVLRIVFDEAHFAFTGEDFRERLRDMWTLRTLPVQFVLLSATIPPSVLPYVRQVYGLSKSCVVVRMCTVRPEIKYELHSNPTIMSNDDVITAAVGLCKKHQPQGQDRAVVFVPSKSMGPKMVHMLQQYNMSAVFYQGPMSQQEQAEAIDGWMLGQYQFLVATNAFGTGNDHAHIRTVIHAGNPMEMLGYIQETGRAGRDQAPATCILVRRGKDKPYSNLSNSDPDHKGTKAIASFMFPTNPGCLRFALTLHCDGYGTQCSSSSDMQICSYCETLSPSRLRDRAAPTSRKCEVTGGDGLDIGDSFEAAMKKTQQLNVALSQRDAEYIQDLKKALTHFTDRCGTCAVLKGETDAACPDVFECDHAKSLEGFIEEYKTWKKGIHYDSRKVKAVCYLCHVPSVHDTLHGPFEKGKRTGCIYGKCVPQITNAIFMCPKLKSSAEVHFNSRWNHRTVFTEWLISPPHPGRHSNMIDLFLWYYKTYVAENIV
ncbi:hypothetical protein HWV62_35150 [Athelia sp. TMB]|nr:hypothetical protein HWV62_35150 [Athelia sp. TMB]